MQPKEKARLITFGKGGHQVYFKSIKRDGGSSQSTLSGYDSPERFERELSKRSDYDFDGAPVVDMIAVVTLRLSLLCPIPDPDLEEGEVSRIGSLEGNIMVDAMKREPGNTYGMLAVAQQAHASQSTEPGPLDKVSVPAYVAYWRNAGARIGRVTGTTITWEE